MIRVRHLGKLLITLVLIFSFGVPKPANAGVLDCINALTGIKTVYALAKEGADEEFLRCSAKMAGGDAVMIAIVGMIVGAGAAGAYKDKDTCNNMITGQIGKLFADLLVHLGVVTSILKKLLGDSAFNELVAFASGQAADGIAQIPALEPVFNYLTCGCSIYGKAKAVAAVAGDYFDDVKECAGVVADLGAAVLDFAESGADAVAELFGHDTDDGPVPVWSTHFAGCGVFTYFPDTAIIRGNHIESTVVTGINTDTTICDCEGGSVLETKPAFEGKIAARCGCSQPPNSTYDFLTKTCGCLPSEKLENGSCVACDTATFSESASGNTVKFGVVEQGICQQKTQTCPAGTNPVKAGSGYYYQCQPTCEPGKFFVQAPGALPSAGFCGGCGKNEFPVAQILKAGKLQCLQCPAGTTSNPGDKACRPLDCANGTDPNNPNACKSACRLVGEGDNKRLVCDGRLEDPTAITCPPKFTKVGQRCVPDVYHKPDVIIQKGMDEKKVVPKEKVVKPDKRKKAEKKNHGTAAEALVDDSKPTSKKKPKKEPGLLGPVETKRNGLEDIGKVIDLGIGLGNLLGSGSSSGPVKTQDSGTSTEPTTPYKPPSKD